MENKWIVVARAMVLFAMLLCCIGCMSRKESSEEKIKFGALSQQERKDYSNAFLEKEYGLSGEVSEVK